MYAGAEGNGVCPEGLAISKEDCYDVSKNLMDAAGMTPKNPELNVGEWSVVPCGCFIYAGEWIDYKDPALGNCKAPILGQLVCKKAPPAPPVEKPTSADFGDVELYPPGEGEGSFGSIPVEPVQPIHIMIPLNKDPCSDCPSITSFSPFRSVGENC